MTTPVLALPLSTPDASPAKKKRVLLLDTSRTKRDMRADVKIQLGMEVNCAADVVEARCWWRADLYNLVLINLAGEPGTRDKFCSEIRGANPPQRVAFFVGRPEYLAAAPHSDQTHGEADADALPGEMVRALLAQGLENSLQQRWGILEASRKISSVRAVSEARSRAIRKTPWPSRWMEATEHSAPEGMRHQPLFATETTTATETTPEREELL